MDELVRKAIEALNKNQGFNEIELTDGDKRVHLIRFTPVPYWCSQYPWTPGYGWTWPQK